MNQVAKKTLIAEFMGYTVDELGYIVAVPLDDDGFDTYDEAIGYDVELMQYDTSFDAIMPVVDKIVDIMSKWDVPNYDETGGYKYWMTKFKYCFWKQGELFNNVVEWIFFYNNMKQLDNY